MEELNLFQFILGLVAIAVWSFIPFCVCYKQILLDRILSRGQYWQIGVIFVLVALVPFGIASIADLCGMHNYDFHFSRVLYPPEEIERIQKEGLRIEAPSLVSAILYQFRGFGNYITGGSPAGREWSLYIGILGTILFSGLLIPSVLSIIQMRAKNYEIGLSRYHIQRSPYAVIIGGHEAVPELIHQILSPRRKQKIEYVIVQTATITFSVYRYCLKQQISAREEFHTVLYAGGRGTQKEMEALRLDKAKEVYVLGENSAKESDAAHDSLNVRCITHIAEILKKSRRKTRLQCFVLFEHQSTFAAFQHSDLSAQVKDQIEFVSLNLYEMWAQNVLAQTRPIGRIRYAPLEGDTRIDSDSRKHVHLIVIGFSKMGVAMATGAAHICHFPNYNSQGIRTRISIIDAAAEKEKDTFIGQYSSLFDLCRWRTVNLDKPEEDSAPEDIAWNLPAPQAGRDSDFIDLEWEFVQGRIEAPATRQWLAEAAQREDSIVTVAVCFAKPHISQTTAVFLPTEVFRHAVQVLVYQSTSPEIIEGLAGLDRSADSRAKMRYNKLRPFGMLGDCFAKTIVDYRLAKLVNYVYWRTDDTKMQHVNDIDPETGLPNQESFWRQTSVALQWSSNYNASAVATKLRFLGLDINTSPIEEIERCLEDPATQKLITNVEHNRWCVEKLCSGFRPLNSKEWDEFAQLRASGMPYKEYEKRKKQLSSGWEMAHLDICSMRDLEQVDHPSIAYDLYLSQALPFIVKTLREEMARS